ncbi:MAG: hypothetical protein R2799_05995 [Crocinitomicaceae bacterium]
MPRNTILHLGNEAQVQITGLRKPCHQINNVQKGLLNEMVVQDDKIPYLTETLFENGEVKPGDEIRIGIS